MTEVERLAAFVAEARDDGLPAATRDALKLRMLDAVRPDPALSAR